MKHPHTPSFPMELPGESDGGVRAHVGFVVEKALKASGGLPVVPSEAFSNRTSGRLPFKRGVSLSAYHPHNSRLYFVFDRVGFNPGVGSVGGRFGLPRSKNSGSELEWLDSVSGSRITVKKKLVEVRLRVVDWSVVDNARPEEMRAVVAGLNARGVELFRSWVSVFGGSSDFVVVRDYWLDHKLDNSLTRKQPSGAIFDTSVVKKVYREQRLEYKGVAEAMNQAHNAGLYDFSPVLVGVLEQNAVELARLNDLVEVRLDPVEAIIGTLRRKEGVWYRVLCDVGPLHDVALRLSVLDMARLSGRLFEENAAGRLRNDSSSE